MSYYFYTASNFQNIGYLFDYNETGFSSSQSSTVIGEPSQIEFTAEGDGILDDKLNDSAGIYDANWNYLVDTDQTVSTNTAGIAEGTAIGADFAYDVSFNNPETGNYETVTIVAIVDKSTNTVLGYVTTGYIPPDVTIIIDINDNIEKPEIAYSSLAVYCFAAGTLIETARGPVAVETLSEGDMVMTRDNGLQPLRWIGRRTIPRGVLQHTPKLRPIRIRAGALGQGQPAADLLVSPQHRVLVRSKIAQKMFGTDEVLVAARQLCQIDGIDVAADLDTVTYVHMLFDRHEIVFSNGAETESLYTGPEALKSVGPAAEEEIFAIFPELRTGAEAPIAARKLASGRMRRKLAVRHMQNGKALIN